MKSRKIYPIFSESCQIKRGFEVRFSGSGCHTVKYPKPIWQGIPQEVRNFILDNCAYADVRPFALLANSSFNFNTAKPSFKKFIDWGIQKDLARLSALNNIAPHKLTEKFNAPKISFASLLNSKDGLAPYFAHVKPSRIVLALSFGKDSLLSWGVAKELGLDCIAVIAHEMDASSKSVLHFKKKIAAAFSRQQHEVFNIYDSDELFPKETEKNLEEASNTNGMFTFTLEFLPFIVAHKARYFVVGNERNMNDYFLTKWGQKAYPAPDQASFYTARQNHLWEKITNGNFSVVSFAEPIFNIAEMGVLFNRYGHLLKYMMSCSPPNGSCERWCYNCPMCAKAYLYSAAVGGDPKKIFFKQDFFKAKYAPLYPLFNLNIHRHYERPKAVRDEQLLAFLMAERRAYKGELMDLFARSARKEALTREKELRKRYLGVHTPHNIPAHMTDQIMKIYSHELEKL